MGNQSIESIPQSQQFMLERLSEMQSKPIADVLGNIITAAYDQALREKNNPQEPVYWPTVL